MVSGIKLLARGRKLLERNVQRSVPPGRHVADDDAKRYRVRRRLPLACIAKAVLPSGVPIVRRNLDRRGVAHQSCSAVGAALGEEDLDARLKIRAFGLELQRPGFDLQVGDQGSRRAIGRRIRSRLSAARPTTRPDRTPPPSPSRWSKVPAQRRPARPGNPGDGGAALRSVLRSP